MKNFTFFLFFILSYQAITREIPRELKDIGVDEQLGRQIHIDGLEFFDENGEKKSFASYFGKDKKPIILMLGYYECPRLCGLLFNGFSNSARYLNWTIGEEFDVIIVSINPDEKSDLARAKKENYLKHYARIPAKEGWHFLTSDEKNVTSLARQVGYKYRYDPAIEQYAHAAAIMILTPEGRVSRYLYGLDFKVTDLKVSLLEASKGQIGSMMEQLILFCYQYDPDSRSYSFMISRLMKLAGALTLLILGAYLFIFWRGQVKLRHA